MISLLLDTCVWLDLAKSPNDEPILASIEDLVEINNVQLIVPEIVISEFARNKERVSESARQRLTQEFKKVRKAIEIFGDEVNKEAALTELDEVNHRLPIISDKVISSIARIEKLFENAIMPEITENIYVKVGKRGLEKKAPFHKHKNSTSDALLMEIFHEETIKGDNERYYFITHNISDFSSTTDDREVHPDYSEYFDGKKTIYQVNIINVLKEIDSDAVEENYFEHEWAIETRSLSEIIDSLDEFEQKVWYGRHGLLVERVEEGKVKIVDTVAVNKYNPHEITKEIWDGAEAAARKVAEKYPGELEPLDDFQWGMLNGKLSALRWILGDEWDMLDT